MRKLIVFSSVLILIIGIVGIILECKKGKNTLKLNNKLLSIDMKNITSVRMREGTENYKELRRIEILKTESWE